MQGIVTTTKGKTYAFRDDHGHDPNIWAWDVHDATPGDRIKTHKWEHLPQNSFAVLFDIDNPPQTVSYVPILS